jgi:hypothetical protein
VWEDAEGLLERLAAEHPDPESLTGWDWEGDLLLALGPPGHLDVRNRTAYYFWGTPEALGVGESMLGWIETIRLGDMLTDFTRQVEAEAEEQTEAGREAARELAAVLGRGGGGGISDDLLRRLDELAPPAVFRAGLPPNPSYRTSELLPITVDVVSFPAGPDSVDVQASFGIPAAAVGIHQVQDGSWRTDLRANLVLVDHQVRVREAFSRQGGYRVAGSSGLDGQVFLDTFRFRAPEGKYVLYLSAEDPTLERSGGVLSALDLQARSSADLAVSPIMLAADIRPAEAPGKFVRGDLQILPVPSRQFFYGQDLYFYFEVDNLSRSAVGDYVWDEAFYVIPESENEGIVRIDPEDDLTGLQSVAHRSMAIDLGSMAETYEGAVFLVVMVTDRTSGESAVSATRFSLIRPASSPDRGR